VKKIDKAEVVSLMAKLKEKYRNEELAVMLERSTQTIYCWGSEKMVNRIPSRSDYNVLKHLLDKSK